MSQALYRKWRPQDWESVVGQEHVILTLRNALAAGRIGHAYLFAGPRGTGKTTTARLLAKAVNCLNEDLTQRPCGNCDYCIAVNQSRFLDLIEIDAASNTSVEDIRDLREKINFTPNQGRYKIYIIDEVHMLSTAAFNALLKTLEEPPAHAIFILATTEVHKIPATVLSRCQRHEFRRIPVTDMVGYLSEIVRQEQFEVELEALTLIARQSTGAMRDAISLLDQLASTGQKITIAMAQNVLGTAASQSVLDVVEALAEKRANTGLDHIHAALDSGSDARQFARQIVDYLRELLLICMGSGDRIETTAEMRAQMVRHAQFFTPTELLRIIKAFNFASAEARSSWQPALPLELAFIDSISIQKTLEQTSSVAVVNPKSQKSTYSEPAELDHPTDIQTKENKIPSSSPNPSIINSGESRPVDQNATQLLTTAWSQILGLVRQNNPSAYGLMNSCKARYIQGDRLIISFASDVLKVKMEKPENLEAAKRALKQVFQREFAVQCVFDTARRDSIPAGVDNDGMVAAALRDLGGELVDIN